MLKNRLSLKLLIAVGLLGIAYSPSFTETACAGSPPATPACDPLFMKSLRERAWREAQREVMTNETFIFKPDSVFSMSCFNSQHSAAESAGSSFSNNGGKLNGVKSAVDSYMGTHFNHATLGGPDGGGQNNMAACNSMKSVWNDAKCRNLTIANFEAFAFKKDSMGGVESNEPRINNSKSCQTNPTATWDDTYKTVKTVGAIKPFKEAESFDSAKLFLNITDPLNLLDPATCAAGIQTGVKIGSDSTNYDEVVCPNPGCVPKYEGGAMVCKPQ